MKGAIRRVFSRSDLRKLALDRTIINHVDNTRPRVKKWSGCALCKNPTPTYQIDIDHIMPLIPLHLTLDDLSWDNVVDNVWCELDNLQGVCKECHITKTKAENKLRRANKKDKDKNEY